MKKNKTLLLVFSLILLLSCNNRIKSAAEHNCRCIKALDYIEAAACWEEFKEEYKEELSKDEKAFYKGIDESGVHCD
jgi:hypothetical protein